MDYEPLDLKPYCNAGVEAYSMDPDFPDEMWHYETDSQPPIGLKTFYGLPFQIGSPEPEPTHCFIALGEGYLRIPLRIEINQTARKLIFAHALMRTRLWQGSPPGEVVARYRIFYQDGASLQVPIRERFEIGNIPLPWGQYPFLCVPDQKDNLVDRYTGRWDEIGNRQTEARQGWPSAYFLWSWHNPYPSQVITHLEIQPTERFLILAAITMGHLDEEPLLRDTHRPVKIDLTDPQNASRPFDLEVEVDRGVATYPYPLPAKSLVDLTPERRGFGAPLNDLSSPAYVEIAATPSATVKLNQAGQTLGAVRWGDLERQRMLELPGLRLEIVDSGKNWTHVEVLDDSTGQPVPCRIAFHSPEGVPYPPHGHHAPLFSNLHTWHIDVGGDVRLGQISYAYIDGRCQGWLPRGKVLVDVARGYEYEPQRIWVEIKPGQQRLTLRLARWVDMNAERYFSGDTHVHFLSTQGSHTEAAGEGLNVVNLLQSQWGHLFTNTEEFTGRPSISPDGDTIVYASQENRQHLLGHLTLLGLKEPVMPWCSAGPDEAEMGSGLDTTLSHWADACHAQGGTVIVPHLPTPNAEPAVLIATGRADAVEMLEHLNYEHLEYYRYLNGGYRLPLVGGTDKMSSSTPVGLYRTYVYIPPDQPFTYENWCRGLRAGRTFLSGGALLWFTVDGHPIGDTLHVPGGGSVEVSVQARSIFPLHTLQIVQEGRVVAETSDIGGSRTLELHERLPIQADTWLAARCAGPQYTALPHFDRRNRGIFAHTSPIYISTSQEDYSLLKSTALQYMLTLVEGSLAYIRQRSPQYPPGRVTFPHGDDDHLAYLEAPFHEAREALHRRMHQMGTHHH
ncbi:MAG: CehA/McbA family metallohydrolase [Anaerolineales bacterium]|jgi:hypothetical protein